MEAGARFCSECGAPLAPAGEEHRKVVTVLFCDVTGSTALGEAVDPETLRGLLAGYFERMRGIVELHGGTVEKFIGDAVMAVFGVPAAHEDDALRACRAAVEMRAAFPELGVEARIGLTTGEVVTGTEERLATGDAVNVAARLEQAAEPGEVLIGEPTLRLVSEAVEVEQVEPLALKGKSAPVPAYRLLRVLGAPGRLFEERFVGRAEELALLRGAWGRVLAERRCELLTVVGEPGVGKSRLVAETLILLEARVVQGRCLPYGEGITYWPVVEVLKQLRSLPADPAAAAAIRSLLGESEQGTSAEEIAWAFRKLVEQEAPLLVVFDDLQWGEETFLDLLEAAALLSSGSAPLLLLCLARPELLDRRPHWPVALHLQPLPDGQVAELIGERVPEALRERITHAAGGNPLFVHEMLAMAAQAGEEVAVPPTLQALLTARLDQLDEPERRLLECAAVEGELFHRGALQALAPDEPQLTHHLAALVRRELIRPQRPILASEEGFRFRHLLIRDAAYDGLPKTTRADLHQRYAAWLEEHGTPIVELDELLGHHLEQAARYHAELGRPDAGLAERAGERLAVAGRRALEREDYRAAVSLLERALEQTRPHRLDVHLEIDLAFALGFVGFTDPRRGPVTAEATAERAHAAGDEAGEALARTVAAYLRFCSAGFDVDEVERLAQAALPLLERAGDRAGLVHVWLALALASDARMHYAEEVEALEQALRYAALAGQRRTDLYGWLSGALSRGPMPADEALARLDELPAETPLGSVLRAMLGRFDEARRIATEADERSRERGGDSAEGPLAEIAALAGDHETAARHLRRACDLLEERGQDAYLSTYAPMLGRELCALGRYEEAEPFARRGRELAAPADVAAQIDWRRAQALVEAHRGAHVEAERLAREAVELSERTDALNCQGDALCDLAEVLHAAGRVDEAAEALEQALERYERKHNWAMVAQVKPRLEAVRAGAPA